MRTLNEQEREVVSQLKARLWLSISRIVEEESSIIDGPQRVTPTPKFIAALVELVYNQLVSLGEDLESFARHGNRKTITPDDLFLVTRKNDDLTTLLKEYLFEMNSDDLGEGKNRRAER